MSRVPRSARGLPFWMRKLGQLWRLVRESHAVPLEGETRLPVAVAEHEAAVTFIGHSSFLVQMGGRNLLIDPVFALRLILLRRKRRPGILISDLPRIHAVLLTHAHMDHLNRPSLRAITREMRRRKLPAPVAIVPHGVEDLVADLGFSRIETLRWWQWAELDGSTPLRITATPAKHWGARLFNDTHRGFGGYVLETPGAPRIYHSGDTAYFGGFREIGQRLRPDVALLPIGAYFPDSYRAVHTSPEEALQAFLDLDAAFMVPMHYNTFRLGREPMDEPLPRLLRAAQKAGVEDQVHPLAEGETWLAPESLTEADEASSLQLAGVIQSQAGD
ncbi:MAG TPA: MBL fold metallo-hydrolase [Chloroflexota bacterium]|nr:MBL fold metallo-hydrolase [Chloroflexota bacterium]